MNQSCLVPASWFSRWIPAPFPSVAQAVAALLLTPEASRPLTEDGQQPAAGQHSFPTIGEVARETTEPRS
jgi:hypothetical protein